MTTTATDLRERTPLEGRRHPLHRFAAGLHEALDRVGEAPVWAMSADELEETATEIYAAVSRLTERALAVVAQAATDDVASTRAATSTAAWLAQVTHRSQAQARGDVRVAAVLHDGSHEAVRQSLAAGEVGREQAEVVAVAVDALPPEVGAPERDRAAQHLLAEAAHHDVPVLRRLGRHLLDVVDPEAADERLARLLQAEEERARWSTSLSLHDDGEGRCHGRFVVPSLAGAMLRSALQALANPALPDPVAREGRCSPEVLGEAFVRYVERMPRGRLPSSGGVSATVVVTMPLETLEGRLGAASLADGLRLSPRAARRLACAAGVVPAVLGTRSAVLDLGRRSRLHTAAQRRAMGLQQGGACAVDGCDRPAPWCDAHHLHGWASGGATSVENGVLVCPRHHTLAHDERFDVVRLGVGRIRFHRRT